MSHARNPWSTAAATISPTMTVAYSHMLGHGVHGITHGVMHHNPVFLTLGVIGIAPRAINPRKKYTCVKSGPCVQRGDHPPLTIVVRYNIDHFF